MFSIKLCLSSMILLLVLPTKISGIDDEILSSEFTGNSVFSRFAQPALVPELVTRNCGRTKGCFRAPDGCEGTECNFAVSYVSDGNYTHFEVSGRIQPYGENVYVAIGFNTIRKMSDASVIDCISYDGKITIQQAHNIDHRSSNPLPNPQEALDERASAGVLADGFLTCRYSRLTSPENSSVIYDLSPPNEYYFLVAMGVAKDPTHKTYHKKKYISENPFNFSAAFLGDEYTSPCIRAHACLMVLSWMFLASFGIITSRYYKNQWPKTEILGLKIWFQIHRTVMLTAVIATATGFATIFIYKRTWSHVPGVGLSIQNAHPYVGVAVMTLALLNPIMAFFRPGIGAPWRSLFNWCHRTVGQTGYLLAVVNIFFGLLLPSANAITPDWLIKLMIAHVAFHVLAEASLVVCNYLLTNNEESDKRELIDMEGNDSVTGTRVGPGLHWVRTAIISCYVPVTLCSTLIIVVTLLTR